MAQISLRTAVPEFAPPSPKGPGRLVLIAPRPRRNPVIVWLSVLAVALGAAVVWRSGVLRQSRAPVSPRTARAEIGRVEQTLRVAGTISADHRDTLLAPYMVGNRHISGGTRFSLVLRQLAAPRSRGEKGDGVAEFHPQNILTPLGEITA